MKQLTKRLLAFAMALTLVCTIAPLTAEAAPNYDKTQTIYMTAKDEMYSSVQAILISNLTKSQTINKSSIKSTNKNIVEPYYVNKMTNTYSYEYKYMDSKLKDNKYSGANYYSNIGLRMKKKGTATISFKIGSKTYKSKITVKAYENPIKTANIAGIKNGKSTNLASKTKNSNYANLKLTSTKKNAVVKFTANSGWKITSVEVADEDNTVYRMSNSDKPVTTASMNVGTLTKNKRVSVRVYFTNTKTKGTLECCYFINSIM